MQQVHHMCAPPVAAVTQKLQNMRCPLQLQPFCCDTAQRMMQHSCHLLRFLPQASKLAQKPVCFFSAPMRAASKQASEAQACEAYQDCQKRRVQMVTRAHCHP